MAPASLPRRRVRRLRRARQTDLRPTASTCSRWRSFRSVVGLGIMFLYLRISPPAVPDTPRARALSRSRIGVLFAAIVYCLFKAIDLIDGADRDPDLFHLSAADRDRRLRSSASSAALEGRVCGARRVLRPRADDRRASAPGSRSPESPMRIGAAVLPRGVLLVDPRRSAVDADRALTTWYSLRVVDGDFRCGIASCTHDLACAADRPMDGSWSSVLSLGVGACDPDAVYLDRAHRAVPHRADHESRAADGDDAQRRCCSAKSSRRSRRIGAAVMLAALVAFQIWR